MAFRAGSNSGCPRLPSEWVRVAQLAAAIAWAAPAPAIVLGAGSEGGPANIDKQFDGVGRVECNDPVAGETGRVAATAWVVGSADTLATAAHLFFRQSHRKGAAHTIAPVRCTFRLYDASGALRDVVRVRYGVSLWADDSRRQDSAYDIALLKLERPVAVASIPTVEIARRHATPVISLIAFHSGVRDTNCAWRTSGQASPIPAHILPDPVNGVRISDTRRLFASSADSTPGSSGGMYYDAANKAAIGIHVGSICAEGKAHYDPESCFNYGLRFDAAAVRMIESVAADRPAASQLIEANSEWTSLQLASLENRLPE